MSLGLKWFEEAANRKEKRDAEGVPISEAVSCLSAYDTSVWPVATEMAAWIYNNWTMAQVYELPELSRNTIFQIIKEKPFVFNERSNGEHKSATSDNNPEEKRWVDWIIEALENLGGKAQLENIYAEIERIHPLNLSRHWHATVRNTIESYSSDSYNYRDTRPDIFYSVAGIGNGFWGLRQTPTDSK
ncbi:MAG: hypothetical protein ABW078_00025 [Sedimenticola sp.]